MSVLAVLGAGGHGEAVADVAESMGEWSRILFFDDAWPGVAPPAAWPLIGDRTALLRELAAFAGVVVAIGDNRTRLDKCREIHRHGGDVVTIVHRAAVVSPHARLGAGSVVCAGAVVDPGAILGEACIVNIGASVSHHCELGPGVHVGGGANLAGRVRVGACSLIGTGAVMRGGLVVGDNVVVGAGAVVVRPVDDGLTVVGNPARPLSRGTVARTSTNP